MSLFSKIPILTYEAYVLFTRIIREIVDAVKDVTSWLLRKTDV